MNTTIKLNRDPAMERKSLLAIMFTLATTNLFAAQSVECRPQVAPTTSQGHQTTTSKNTSIHSNPLMAPSRSGGPKENSLNGNASARIDNITLVGGDTESKPDTQRKVLVENDKANGKERSTTAPQAYAQMSAQTKTKIYGDSKEPVISGMKQGDEDDCYFYSVLGWYAANDPTQLESMISWLGGNKYQVKFPNGQVEEVTLKKGSNTPYSNLNKKDGTWIDVLTNAYAKLMGEPVSKVLQKGETIETYGNFTQQQYDYVTLSQMSVSQMFSLLSQSSAANLPVGLTAGNSTAGYHALTVLRFTPDSSDPGDSKLTVWNPWGTSEWFNPSTLGSSTSKSSPGAGWIKMTNGQFTITLNQLNQSGNAGFNCFDGPQSQVPQPLITSGAAYNENYTPIAPVTSSGSPAGTSSPQQTSTVGVGAQGGREQKNSSKSETEKHHHPVALSSQTDVSESSDSTKRVTLNCGSAFVAREQTVAINAQNGTVKLDSQAVAFVVRLDDKLAVYNLGEDHDGKVHIDFGNGEILDVSPGQAVLLCAGSSVTSDQANPLPAIKVSNAKSVGVYNGQNAFAGMVMAESVLETSPQFKQLMASPRKTDRALVDKLLKLAAAQHYSEAN